MFFNTYMEEPPPCAYLSSPFGETYQGAAQVINDHFTLQFRLFRAGD
jgi:hypothetical protein